MTEETNPGGASPNPEEGLTPSANDRFKWYIIHAYSGFERKVKESIEGRVEAFGLQNRIGRVMIPTEPVTEVVNGKKRTIERVFLPGYVLVEMDLDNDLWHVMKNTPRVTGFSGDGRQARGAERAGKSARFCSARMCRKTSAAQDQV